MRNPETGFNGAATLSLRKRTSRRPEAPIGPPTASMGPQLYRCGNWLLAALQEGYLLSCACFNGAATLSLRKLEGSTRAAKYVSRHRNRFNGAATLSLRKPSKSRLQSMNGQALEEPASMGPQLYRCGNLSAAITMADSLSYGFNGAATLSLRKLWHHTATPGRPLDTHPLQWGRNFIVAETS